MSAAAPFNLKNHDFDEFFAKLSAQGATRTAALKLFASVFSHRAQSMADVRTARMVPAVIRDWVQTHGTLPSLEVVERRRADDGFVKYLFASPLGGRFEAVRIPLFDTHYVVCVSSQVGCALACDFCMTGKMGFSRNLETWEVVDQVLQILTEADRPVRGVVFMGMGEPLLNYENLSAALDVVHDEMGLGARKITVSTVGFPERLNKLAPKKPRFQLAISLHTPFQEQRDVLVPAMKGVPIEDILAAGDFWFATTGREITYEVILLGGDNDTPLHAERLVALLRGRRCSVNLIPFNPVAGSPFRRPSPERVEDFRAALEHGGLVATVRWSRGVESDAACGQLRLRSAKP